MTYIFICYAYLYITHIHVHNKNLENSELYIFKKKIDLF